jgi:hypothetical protein
MTSPSSLMGTQRRRAPFSSHSICQGTMFEWCSRPETSTSSPSRTRDRPKVEATRLMASVVPRVKMISRVEAAFRKPWAFTRPAS